MNQPNDHGQTRNHLFSPHTDQCVYCGQSARDDAVENTPCNSDQPTHCEACGGKGWLLAENDEHGLRIERCDACQMFDSDLAALEAVEKAARAQPALLRFVESIAGLKHEGEPGDQGASGDGPFEITSEDAIATLNQMILQARELLGTAEKCQKCGKTVAYIIGCPDGTEVCQECFDAGQI